MAKVNNKIVTILTPTYNRAGLLSRLYGSLVEQTRKHFDWVIVDDGSTDETEENVREWINQDILSVRYIRKENGGKHTALNCGIRTIFTPLTFIVDSDDYLSQNAIETIQLYYDRFFSVDDTEKKTGKLCGFSFLRVYSDGVVNAGEFPVDDCISSYRDARVNAHILGDKAEVYLTDVLKLYPFPKFPGEKYVPEDAVWIQMSGPYQMVHANRRIYVCDYLDGGLTRSGRYMKVQSPFGMMYRSAMYIKDPEVCLWVQIKMILLYQVYYKFAQDKLKCGKISEYDYLDSMHKCIVHKGFVFLLMQIPSFFIFKRWKHIYAGEKR